MSDLSTTSLNASRFVRLALIAGAAGLVVAVIGLFVSGAEAFFQAYLFAYLFWFGISMGSLALLLLFFVANGRWGLAIRRITEAAAANIGLLAILFLPVVFGISRLYPWAYNREMLDTPYLAFKAAYLTTPFFLVRAIIYFAVWFALVYLANRAVSRIAAASLAERHAAHGRMQAWGAGGLIVFVLTMTFASFDWIMSLQPLWTSTAFGLITIVGQALTALSFALLMLNMFPSLSLGQRWTTRTTPIPYKDLGALLLTFVMGWMYLQYFQFLIIWGANIPREVVWYQDRNTGGWQVLSWIIVIFQFVLPFLVLLSGRVRHNLRLLAGLGGMLLVVHLINTFWHVKPAFSPGAFAVSWLDIVLPVAIGGIWLAGFFYYLQRRPALNADDAVVLEAAPPERVHV